MELDDDAGGNVGYFIVQGHLNDEPVTGARASYATALAAYTAGAKAVTEMTYTAGWSWDQPAGLPRLENVYVGTSAALKTTYDNWWWGEGPPWNSPEARWNSTFLLQLTGAHHLFSVASGGAPFTVDVYVSQDGGQNVYVRGDEAGAMEPLETYITGIKLWRISGAPNPGEDDEFWTGFIGAMEIV